MLLPSEEWITQLDRDYLGDFIGLGGAAVKFVVPCDDLELAPVTEALEERARARRFLVVPVSAATTKVQMIDKVFADISSRLPWEALATEVLLQLASRNAMGAPTTLTSESVASQLAACNDLDEDYVRLTLERALGNEVFKDRLLTKDFRIAMTWLCRARLNGGEEASTITSDISLWLRGEASVSVTRQYALYAKVNRFNARHLLASLFTWVRRAGRPGTLIVLDARNLTLANRPDDGSIFYTKAALLDAYEVFRQFIDDTDELSGVLLCVLAGEQILDTDGKSRGLGAYQALMHRVYDEVRDRDRVNPRASLVRLGGGV